jgi:hypothetical protein
VWRYDGTDPPGGSDPGGHTTEDSVRVPEEWTLFAPMAFDGLGWVRIAGPQDDARQACMSVTARIHLLQGLPLSELDARAESAVRQLEDGAVSVRVIDDAHRVDRIILLSAAVLPHRHPPAAGALRPSAVLSDP